MKFGSERCSRAAASGGHGDLHVNRRTFDLTFDIVSAVDLFECLWVLTQEVFGLVREWR